MQPHETPTLDHRSRLGMVLTAVLVGGAWSLLVWGVRWVLHFPALVLVQTLATTLLVVGSFLVFFYALVGLRYEASPSYAASRRKANASALRLLRFELRRLVASSARAGDAPQAPPLAEGRASFFRRGARA
jgi:hypothetical protein